MNEKMNYPMDTKINQVEPPERANMLDVYFEYLIHKVTLETDINSPELKEEIGRYIGELQKVADIKKDSERDIWFNEKMVDLYKHLSKKNDKFIEYYEEARDDLEILKIYQ